MEKEGKGGKEGDTRLKLFVPPLIPSLYISFTISPSKSVRSCLFQFDLFFHPQSRYHSLTIGHHTIATLFYNDSKNLLSNGLHL